MSTKIAAFSQTAEKTTSCRDGVEGLAGTTNNVPFFNSSTTSPFPIIKPSSPV